MFTKASYQPKDGRIVPFFAKDENLECGCYNGRYGVYSLNTAFLPFVLNLNLTAVQAFSVNVFDAETGKRFSCISSAAIPHNLYKMGDSTHRFVYSGERINGFAMPLGMRYYIELLGFRSCEFTAVIETDCLMKVTLGNTNELFGLPYHRGWTQWVWTDGLLGGYDFERFSIDEKDDLGRTRTVQSRLEKIWNIEFFAASEPIYKVLATSSMLDFVAIQQGAVLIEGQQKRSVGAIEKGAENCERTIILKLPDSAVEPVDGACTTVDEWEDVDTEIGLNTCDLDVWIETGRVRCVPNTGVGGCNPLPAFSVVTDCQGGAGRIIITPTATPPGQTVEFSVDNGSTFKDSGVFAGLASGAYQVRTRHVGTLCMSEAIPVAILCGDGTAPVWEATGVSFCLQTVETEVIWEETGVSFCLAVEESTDGLLGEIWLYPGDESDLGLL